MKRVTAVFIMVLCMAMGMWAQGASTVIEKYKSMPQVTFYDVTDMVKSANGADMIVRMARGKLTPEQYEYFQKNVTKMQILVVQNEDAAKGIIADMNALKGYEMIEKQNMVQDERMPGIEVNAKFFLHDEEGKLREMVALIDMKMLTMVCLIDGEFDKEEMVKMFVESM